MGVWAPNLVQIIFVPTGEIVIWSEKNWHVALQLSCHDMCQIVTWLDNLIKNLSNENFH